MPQDQTQPYLNVQTQYPSALIAILTKTFEGAYHGNMIQHSFNSLTEFGYQTIVRSSGDGRDGELEALASLEACGCDGYIIESDYLTDQELAELLTLHPNSVLMNRYVAGYGDRCVYLDNFIGGAIAAEYLTKNGHTNIAMVTGPRYMVEVKDRSAGFVNRLIEREIDQPSLIIEGTFFQESGFQAMNQIVNSSNDITAVFIQNDEMALGAINFCRDHDISIPEQYSIIGYDNSNACEHAYPRLTSIHQPLANIGLSCAELLNRIMQRDDENNLNGWVQAYFRPHLVERDSVTEVGDARFRTLLTNRESQCLEWTAKGKTSWEISVILGMAEGTANFHLRNAGVKLGANNRTHAVAKAMEQGLLKI